MCRTPETCYYCIWINKKYYHLDDPNFIHLTSHYPYQCDELRKINCSFCGEKGHDQMHCNSEYKPRK
jgi:hypothetical protein